MRTSSPLTLGQVPVFGLLRAVDARGHLRALLNAFVSIVFGSIGIWLPLSISFGIDPHAKLIAHDIFIVVPSLVAPLFILLFSQSQGGRLRSHQVALIALSITLSIVALIYWARSGSSPEDGMSVYVVTMMVASFLLLYCYFLHYYVSDSEVVSEVKSTEKSVAEKLRAKRKSEGKPT